MSVRLDSVEAIYHDGGHNAFTGFIRMTYYQGLKRAGSGILLARLRL